METVQMLGNLGEFVGAIAVVATLVYLSIQVRHARGESEKALLEARSTAIRELTMSAATSEVLTSALLKAEACVGDVSTRFETELISRGLAPEDARRVLQHHIARLLVDQTQYLTAPRDERSARDAILRNGYARGLGRLFWESMPASARQAAPAFFDHVERLVVEFDGQPQGQP